MIIDASAMLDVLLRTERGRAVEELVVGAAADLQAPAILDLEVAQVLRRMQLGGHLDPTAAGESLELCRDLVATLHPTRSLLGRAWDLRHNVTISDALYLASAEASALPLLTTDDRLARAAARHTRISVVAR